MAGDSRSWQRPWVKDNLPVEDRHSRSRFGGNKKAIGPALWNTNTETLTVLVGATYVNPLSHIDCNPVLI